MTDATTAHVDPKPVERAALPAIRSGAPIAAIIPTSADEAYRLAKAFAISGLAPKNMKEPEQIMVAIMAGLELGMSPFQSIQSFAVINGRPTMWGDGLLAVVRAQRVRVKEWLDGEGESLIAWCEVYRPDTSEVVTRSFSWADAKKANLSSKEGPWQSYPKRMLQMRARAWAVRDGCADMLRGMQIREEVEDYEPLDITPKPAGVARRLEARGQQEGQNGFTSTHVATDAPTAAAAARAVDDGPVPQDEDEIDEFEIGAEIVDTEAEVEAIVGEAETQGPAEPNPTFDFEAYLAGEIEALALGKTQALIRDQDKVVKAMLKEQGATDEIRGRWNTAYLEAQQRIAAAAPRKPKP